MVLLESVQLGHSVYVTSYVNSCRERLESKIWDKFEKIFHYVLDVCVEFTRKNGKFPQPVNGPFLVNQMCRLMDTYMNVHVKKNADEVKPVPNDLEDKVYNSFIFSVIWGIGGALDETTRPRFDTFLQDILLAENVCEKYKLQLGPDSSTDVIKIPNKIGNDFKSLFDLVFD